MMMSMHSKLPDFDALSQLYREDPAAFEAFRCYVLRRAVNEAPQRHRPALEELLLCIEAKRQGTSTPVEAAQEAFQMMRQSLSQLNTAWQLGLQSIAKLQSDALMQKLRIR
jgi:hypothetical protein